MRSVMKHQFSRVPNVSIPRSTFDRTHAHKTTFDADYLIPIYTDIAYPGDSFTMNMAGFGRMSTPLYPVMDNLSLDTQFFAVPLRILQNNFVKMMGEQDNPADSIDFIAPEMTSPATVGYGEQSIHDYFGIPTKIADLTHNSYWHRAYNLIWNTWYRDQNLQNSVVVDLDDGPDDPADYVLLKRGKRHDYFTSCLPWPLKGGVDVDIPLGTSAVVESLTGVGNAALVRKASDDTLAGADSALASDSSSNLEVTGVDSYWDPNGTLHADLSTATAATINQLRQAFQVQRLLERDARGGTRFIELVKSHFGVTSPDFRMQRPEYLGGGSTPINITPIASTAYDNIVQSHKGLGELGAMSTVAVRDHAFTKSFTEHCVIIGLASVKADLTYQQGLNRQFSISDRYDFYWPSLSMLGEQAILNKEIYADGSANDELVFGYNERYAELRYKPSQITGQFRSNSTTPLDSWHLSQEFASLPGLNSAFIESNTPMDRVLATPTEPDFIMDFYFQLRCARPLPLYGVPGMIDHF